MLCLLLLLTTAIIAQAADQEMIVAMKTGETHLSSDILESEHRWFQLQTASLSARYQYIANVAEIDASSRLQYQPDCPHVLYSMVVGTTASMQVFSPDRLFQLAGINQVLEPAAPLRTYTLSNFTSKESPFPVWNFSTADLIC